jgi:methyltransferase
VSRDPVPLLLAGFLAWYILERGAELVISARHSRALLARGGREFGQSHFPWLVVMHTLFPLALVAEVLLLHVRPGPLWPFWCAVWLGAQFLRGASMLALGGRWSTRVIVIPGEAPVTRGVYRWMRHPNYLAVVAELLATPLLLGAWRTAIVFSLANALALSVRIRCEDHALAEAAAPRG